VKQGFSLYNHTCRESFKQYEMEPEPSQLVSDFKEAWSKLSGCDAALADVIYKHQVRPDSGPIADEDTFEPNAPGDVCFIHVRVRDPKVDAEVARRLAAGETCVIPLDQVKVRE
jgi:hypothetical protein